MSLAEYLSAQQRNLEAITESPHYSRLIETIDRLYRSTIDLGPAHCPRVCFGKMLLMCHKSLLSAATLIARGQPEDSRLSAAAPSKSAILQLRCTWIRRTTSGGSTTKDAWLGMKRVSKENDPRMIRTQMGKGGSGTSAAH